MRLLKAFVLLVCILPSLRLDAQNLVINPSFETITSCPLGPSELEKATPWRNPFTNIVGDTCSTSDLFNTCNFLGPLGVGVPANIMGNEPAQTGNGYAGIILYEGVSLFGCLNFFGTGWREYVEGTLTAPLVAGQTYCVSFHISLADNVKFATDDIGVYLSTTEVAIDCSTVGSASNLPFTPQLQHADGDIINTAGWVQLSWDYLASGGEQYITIGNFKNDANTSYTCVNSSAFLPYAYYYIDDVAVVPGSCSQEPCQVQVAVIDMVDVACFGGANGAATVEPSNGVAPYEVVWEPGGLLGATQQELSAGSYTVTATDQNGCTAQATVVLGQPEAPLDAQINGTTDASCGGTDGTATALASGGTPPYLFAWLPSGSTGATATGLGAGGYTVTITDQNGCTSQATATVSEEQTTAAISGPTLLCNGEEIVLTASGGSSFLWNTNDTSASIIVTSGGTYSVIVTGCGSAEATWVVSGIDVLSAFTVLPTEGYAPLNVAFTNGSVPSGADHMWDFGDGTGSGLSDPLHTYDDPGLYVVVLTTSYMGCTGQATVGIVVLEAPTDSELWVPNVFSPNGDGHNDQWGPVARGLVSLHVDIYNRWGQLVFSMDRPSATWQGRTSAGEAVPDGTYFYILQAAGVDGRTYAEQGTITLLR